MKSMNRVGWLMIISLYLTVIFVGCSKPVSNKTPEEDIPAKIEIQDNIQTEEEEKSLLDFLKIATQPVGSTMYVWGGGWNEDDTAAGVEAVTIGLSPSWKEFATKQDSSYDYNKTKYQIHDGLDCSGYVGWAVYNTLETENGKEGYVLTSTQIAENYATRGLGNYISASDMTVWHPGDIMSMKGHVWIVVGMCEDGSVLFLHSSPPGVAFCGTNLANGNKSQAVILAEQIMNHNYPEWYAKYPDCARSYSYQTDSSAMRWSQEILGDKEGLRQMTAEEITKRIFDLESCGVNRAVESMW